MAVRAGKRRRERVREASGQAAAELVAVVPLLVFAVLALGQLAVAGYAAWSAANAARAGARAAHVGGDGERAALRSLPAPLRGDARVTGGDGIEVRVRAPALIPGLPAIPVAAAASLDPAAEASGGG